MFPFQLFNKFFHKQAFGLSSLHLQYIHTIKKSMPYSSKCSILLQYIYFKLWSSITFTSTGSSKIFVPSFGSTFLFVQLYFNFLWFLFLHFREYMIAVILYFVGSLSGNLAFSCNISMPIQMIFKSVSFILTIRALKPFLSFHPKRILFLKCFSNILIFCVRQFIVSKLMLYVKCMKLLSFYLCLLICLLLGLCDGKYVFGCCYS